MTIYKEEWEQNAAKTAISIEQMEKSIEISRHIIAMFRQKAIRAPSAPMPKHIDAKPEAFKPKSGGDKHGKRSIL